MVTVSTLQSEKAQYHHGDMRAALVEAGLRALETSDFADISLRQLAREVGVSATAVYRHFPDKQALLQALGQEGMEMLGRAQQAAAEAAGPESSGFAATGRAYVRFALAHPALFRLVFSQCEEVGDAIFGDTVAARLLQEKAEALTGGDPQETERLMVQAWAVVHGLAMLMMDKQLPAEDDLIDRVIDPDTLFRR